MKLPGFDEIRTAAFASGLIRASSNVCKEVVDTRSSSQVIFE